VKKLLGFAGTSVVACAVLAATAGARTTSPVATALAAHQEPQGIGQLVVPGDRVEIVYRFDTAGVKAPAGSLYVRNDLAHSFERLPLKANRHSALVAVVPAQLIRGHRLLYYAVLRDARTGRSVTVPARGASQPASAWILERPLAVKLGVHRFGRTAKPEALVARAGADQVGWRLDGDSFGPQTFLVGRDGSVWLHDGLKQRLLVWRRGQPDVVDHTVSLPFFAADNDVALGPGGTMYVTGGEGTGLDFHALLFKLSATGQILWQERLASDVRDTGAFLVGTNSLLRFGPDGTLYLTVGMPGRPGGDLGWMPVATPDGRPIGLAAQRNRTSWPGQPVAGRLRLVSEVYVPPGRDTAPHEARFALLDRRGRVVRAWRVTSRTAVNFTYATPELVGGDPVVLFDVTAGAPPNFKWEYLVLRLGPQGLRTSLSLRRSLYGDNLLADLRVGPDGKLYQLSSSPSTGIAITRYSLGAIR
jgi:hypothetical protein